MCHSDGTLSSSLSLTSRLSGSVVLASRLPTNTHVFAFILCALMLFALSPMLARQLTVRLAFPIETSPSLISLSAIVTCPLQTVAFPLSVVWFAATLALLFLVARSPTSAAIFTIVHIGLVVLGPAALVCSWSEKRSACLAPGIVVQNADGELHIRAQCHSRRLGRRQADRTARCAG